MPPSRRDASALAVWWPSRARRGLLQRLEPADHIVLGVAAGHRLREPARVDGRNGRCHIGALRYRNDQADTLGDRLDCGLLGELAACSFDPNTDPTRAS